MRKNLSTIVLMLGDPWLKNLAPIIEEFQHWEETLRAEYKNRQTPATL